MNSPVPAVATGFRPALARVAVLLLVYSTVAGFAVSEFIRYPGLASVKPWLGGESFFGDMVYGRAPQPYVTRVLVPWLVRTAVAVTPSTARSQTETSARHSLTSNGRPLWLHQYPFEFTLAKNILLLFAIGFAFALWWLARLTLDVPAPAVDAIPVVSLFALPGLYGYGSMLYDLPALSLFTLGLASIAARRQWPYALLFAVCVLNKETGLLLTLVWAVSEARRRKPRQLAVGIGLQVCFWLVTRGLLFWYFRNNPGEPLALHLLRNAQVLAVPGNWFLFRPVTDWLILPRGFNVLYLFGFIASLYALHRAPQFLRDAYWVVLPVFVLTWLFGNVDEMRVYYELLPIVTLVLFSGLYRLMGYRPQPAASAAT
ncbi:hypothetical protein FJY68_05850 [candidate division WOR-3 bacterium]|uniref:Uncharacterized protein n=1 Tax=candidate division WOR-3 bacterium TaxID=2052148 RepID=A0A938BT98_UNCW3|nr:hypothetical protein [candidate division WOR-3 bacterium]